MFDEIEKRYCTYSNKTMILHVDRRKEFQKKLNAEVENRVNEEKAYTTLR